MPILGSFPQGHAPAGRPGADVLAGSDFVFLDEPFGASRRAEPRLVLQDKLLRLWEKMQSTVVLVSHYLAEAVALADRVVVMSARPGRIAADIRSICRGRALSALYKA